MLRTEGGTKAILAGEQMDESGLEQLHASRKKRLRDMNDPEPYNHPGGLSKVCP